MSSNLDDVLKRKETEDIADVDTDLDKKEEEKSGYMTDIEKNIAKNIKALRIKAGLKQSDIGEKVSYSDKTVSKWENGSSVPDISTLCALAEIFHLTVDDLVKPDAVSKYTAITDSQTKETHANEIAMLCLSILTVYMIVVFVFVAILVLRNYDFWQLFVWGVCPSALLVYRYNRNNDNVKWVNTLSLSLFLWSLIVATFLQLLSANLQLWPIFFLGIPLQAMIIISTLFRTKKSTNKS